MTIPDNSIAPNPRRIEGYVHGGMLAPKKPADSITISLEFLRGVEAAADTSLATDLLTEDERITLAEEAITGEIARLREEVTK